MLLACPKTSFSCKRSAECLVPRRNKLSLCPFCADTPHWDEGSCWARSFHILAQNSVLLKWVCFKDNLGPSACHRHIFSDGIIVPKERWGDSATKHSFTQRQGCPILKAKQLPKGSKLSCRRPPIWAAPGSRVPKQTSTGLGE